MSAPTARDRESGDILYGVLGTDRAVRIAGGFVSGGGVREAIYHALATARAEGREEALEVAWNACQRVADGFMVGGGRKVGALSCRNKINEIRTLAPAAAPGGKETT